MRTGLGFLLRTAKWSYATEEPGHDSHSYKLILILIWMMMMMMRIRFGTGDVLQSGGEEAVSSKHKPRHNKFQHFSDLL